MGEPDTRLLRATAADVPELARIAALSFENDAHTQMKETVPGRTSFETGMVMGLTQWIQAEDKCAVLKAVRAPDDTIVGFISWAFRGVPIDPVPGGEASTRPAEGSAGGSSPATAAVAAVSQQPQSPSADAQRIAALERMMGEHLAGFQRRVMPEGTRCMYVGTVSVDPRHRGAGVGSRLVRWGTDQADRAGVFCWAHSSEAGWRMFAKQGFRAVDGLTVDLDRYAPEEVGAKGKGKVNTKEAPDGAGPEGRVWGRYTFRYMVRRPATLAAEGYGEGRGAVEDTQQT